jgi:ParB family transcriptional regulator, chromosome partitioning protein
LIVPTKKTTKGLGRGFDSLLPTEFLNEAFDPTASQDEKVSELRHIKVSDIFPDPEQPRRHFDELALEELAHSLKEHGVIQPIVVINKKDGYQIVAGERRWRAAKMAQLDKMPAIVRTLSNQHKLELSLIENLQRRDLNPLETATAYMKLRDQFNLTYEQIGARIGGKAVSTIANIIRLLQLPEAAKEALIAKKIREAHARQILALDTPEAQQELLDLIIKEDWSVHRTEQYVVGYKKGAQTPDKRESALKRTQTETPTTKALAERLKTPVSIKSTAKGGQLIIRFKDEGDLERISKLIN